MLITNYMTQKKKILDMLRLKREVPVYMFSRIGIMQYNARIFELRKEGHKIKCTRVRQPDGQINSYYRLEE